MMAYFTPGPWTIKRRKCRSDGKDYGYHRIIRVAHRTMIARMGDTYPYQMRPFIDDETMEDNARLIAQSPALYEIAAGLIDISDMHGFDAAEILAGIEELAEKAEAVIALVDRETT
jgi:hypothetical protein